MQKCLLYSFVFSFRIGNLLGKVSSFFFKDTASYIKQSEIIYVFFNISWVVWKWINYLFARIDNRRATSELIVSEHLVLLIFHSLNNFFLLLIGRKYQVLQWNIRSHWSEYFSAKWTFFLNLCIAIYTFFTESMSTRK